MTADGITDPRHLAFSYVRFSSEKQRQGASLERQTEAAQRWADENGYVLDKSLNLNDEAVSAFRGDNTTVGKLATFKALTEQRLIPQGSVLIVENLDRISRQSHRKAARVLEDILEAGVDVVTLQDGKRYTLKDLDEDPLTSIMIILTFSRAHEESLTKSKRVKDGWQRNLAKVKEGKRLRSRAIPSWLKLVGGVNAPLDNGHFEIIHEKAEVMRELFQRFADGETVWSIAKGFRDRDIKTPRGKTYASGNIYRLVSSKAPYGILEIGKGTKNDRTVIDQIEGYFPRIVDEDVQRRVMMRLQDMNRFKTKEAKALTSPKRKTHGILTGVIWSPEKAGGNRAVCRKGSDGSYAYVDGITRRWVAKREVIERPFLEGWPEIVIAYETDTTPELNDAEEALTAALTALEFAHRSGSERLVLAAQADVEEAQSELKELHRGQALALQEIPESLDGMEPWEANQVVRRLVERVNVVRGEQRQQRTEGGDGRVGKKVMLEVKLRNKVKVYLGDQELMFG
ncbi:recombinase family protein [Seohaeicola saemankumensis]|uniref:Recombinase family protein n=1 Tax=Seohaeicola saemankumensis TaxID=481181 RepID=A0ABW3TAC8_9RHOB